MKIAIMGTGGVGGYYGGLLARAGHEVTFIARGAHLAAILDKGLQVKSVFGDFQVSPAQATDKPATVGLVDLVLFSTKTYHTDDAAQLIKPMIGQDTAVISFQNGVDAAERIGPVVGMEHLLGGATWLSAAIEGPGVIGQYSQFRRIAVGEFDGRVTPRAQAIGEALKSTGASVELVQNIVQDPLDQVRLYFRHQCAGQFNPRNDGRISRGSGSTGGIDRGHERSGRSGAGPSRGTRSRCGQ